MGLSPVHHFIPELYQKIVNNEFHTDGIITHRLPLAQADIGYQIFNDREDECVKIILKP
jgi:S-(hydroxymethyl)glutathione dehydrogenase/alcohol dehydrogenase